MFGVPVEDVAVAQHFEGGEERLRLITKAIAGRRALWVIYVAKQRQIRMTFSPHAIVRAPDRLHVRGHAAEDGGETGYFMDLVPSRILECRNLASDEYVGSGDDISWHRRVTLKASLNPELPEKIAAALAQEFGATYVQVRNVREALRLYYARSLRGRRVEGFKGRFG